MDTKELIGLIETLKAMGYGHIDITHEGTHVMLDTNSLAGVVAPGTAASVVAAPAVSAPVATTTVTAALEDTVAAPAAEVSAPAVDDPNLKVIESPIVGTFYTAASPDAPAFVKVGDKIKKGDIVCIVEAMKLMNEIESEFDGEVVEVCVNNESPVEYGQALFKIK